MSKFSAKETVFTSESVCAGHPDKIADQISDAILDQILIQDSQARVAVETLVAKQRVVLAGEISTTAQVDYREVARSVIAELGYTNPAFGFDGDATIASYIHQQSPDIAVGVDRDGAGDQGMMFGYATSENGAYLPWPIWLAHQLSRAIDQARISGAVPYLRPDGKTQVGVRYVDGKAVGIDSVIMAVPHAEHVSQQQLQSDLEKVVVGPILQANGFDRADKIVVNGTGVWHIGGPSSDVGLTGRKIVVDGYGGMARVGGGCFSGKDPSKVDRSGAYAARYLAKNIVAAGLADQAEVRLAYVIGQSQPLMQEVETFGTAKKNDKTIADYTAGLLDTSVRGIIEGLALQQPTYKATASYGHFGREEFSWERIVSRI